MDEPMDEDEYDGEDPDPDECIYHYSDEFGIEICGRDDEECLGADCDFVTTVRRCRICGCTDDDCHQCIEKTGEPCYWVEFDLCSACAKEVTK
jgi:hypothetical protein